MEKAICTARHQALVDLIIRKRKLAGWTQAQLAAAIGVRQSLVARIESGQRRIDVVELFCLAEALRFDPVAAIMSIERVTAPADSVRRVASQP